MWVKQQTCIFSQFWMLEVQGPLGSGETSLFAVCSHGLSLVPLERGEIFFFFLYGHQFYWIRTPPLQPHLTLIISYLKISFPIKSLTYDLGSVGHNLAHLYLFFISFILYTNFQVSHQILYIFYFTLLLSCTAVSLILLMEIAKMSSTPQFSHF